MYKWIVKVKVGIPVSAVCKYKLIHKPSIDNSDHFSVLILTISSYINSKGFSPHPLNIKVNNAHYKFTGIFNF